jgi:hypothetical protein
MLLTKPHQSQFTIKCPTRCANCGSHRVVQILYGEPSIEVCVLLEIGEVVLGGCMVDPSNPSWKCVICGQEYFRKGVTIRRQVYYLHFTFRTGEEREFSVWISNSFLFWQDSESPEHFQEDWCDEINRSTLPELLGKMIAQDWEPEYAIFHIYPDIRWSLRLQCGRRSVQSHGVGWIPEILEEFVGMLPKLSDSQNYRAWMTGLIAGLGGSALIK